eukprot:11758339-Alexandrium_andersonii.AAC.1
MFADSEPWGGPFGGSGELGGQPHREGLGQSIQLRTEGPVTLWVFRPMTGNDWPVSPGRGLADGVVAPVVPPRGAPCPRPLHTWTPSRRLRCARLAHCIIASAFSAQPRAQRAQQDLEAYLGLRFVALDHIARSDGESLPEQALAWA